MINIHDLWPVTWKHVGKRPWNHATKILTYLAVLWLCTPCTGFYITIEVPKLWHHKIHFSKFISISVLSVLFQVFETGRHPWNPTPTRSLGTCYVPQCGDETHWDCQGNPAEKVCGFSTTYGCIVSSSDDNNDPTHSLFSYKYITERYVGLGFCLCKLLIHDYKLSPGQMDSQVDASFGLAFNLCFVWPPTCDNLRWLWSSSNLDASRCKFFTVWPPSASRHKLITSTLLL